MPRFGYSLNEKKQYIYIQKTCGLNTLRERVRHLTAGSSGVPARESESTLSSCFLLPRGALQYSAHSRIVIRGPSLCRARPPNQQGSQQRQVLTKRTRAAVSGDCVELAFVRRANRRSRPCAGLGVRGGEFSSAGIAFRRRSKRVLDASEMEERGVRIGFRVGDLSSFRVKGKPSTD